ncbi:amino acid deaminase [Streptomyces globosus]|uniref:Amino acid deaminase n=1 Tax=Streptomyces globosus TaxID=68209 RepID=A0A344TVQ7_9ACTN|nr:alanine racemase [Streptomyces globosus]AXE22728.1 amino acid deaminase [Streptomyces globosus]
MASAEAAGQQPHPVPATGGQPARTTVREAVRELDRERVDHRFKGLPPDAAGAGLTVGELATQHRDLHTGGFTTPVLTLDGEALDHNLAALAAFCDRHGLEFAPHGKTCMAPRLFERQLELGAWGITVAMPHQARVCRAFGIRRIFLANELVDAPALHWVAAELAADPEFEFVAYVDSVRGVALMDAALAGRTTRPVDVVVELGAGAEGRTGVRTAAECLEVARAVAAAPTLRLAGVAGYEATMPGADADSVREWLRRLVALAADFDAAGLFKGTGLERIVVSAGGSEWFDAVAEVFAGIPELSLPVQRLLRSGAYVSHDHGWYSGLTPFNRHPEEGGLLPAFRLWTQVVSRPTPGQAFVNAGKRDIAYDLGLPEVLAVRGADGTERPGTGITVVKLSDQHAWLETAPGAALEVGDRVALGMAHPCTIFEKWPLIPVTGPDGTVTELVRTFF